MAHLHICRACTCPTSVGVQHKHCTFLEVSVILRAKLKRTIDAQIEGPPVLFYYSQVFEFNPTYISVVQGV